ncbi:MAG TPA: Uma2 family endonuclease [Gemmataceae bacterium]|nr:Uma2 family endonuclease [Gemmataceae bacterium]
MTTLAAPPSQPAPAAPPLATLADLIERLGGVPLHRIRVHPAPGTAVEQDVLEAAKQGLVCELVDGVLVEVAMGFRESLLALALGHLLYAFVHPRNLGLVTGEHGTVRLFPGLVRIPDVAFASWDRVPGRRVPDEAMPLMAPDLAVEVLSEGNTPGEMARKRHDYFSAGARLVWLAEPRLRIVDVCTSESQVVRLTPADVLDGGDVLPGFQLPLRDWFAELDRHG